VVTGVEPTSTDDDAPAAWCRRGEHQTSPPVTGNLTYPPAAIDGGAWPSASTAVAVPPATAGRGLRL